MDVSILIGAVLTRYSAVTGDSEFARDAERLVTYVVRRQTPAGAWFYTDPPQDSPVKHDNYHTGFILDALSEYMHFTDDGRFQDVYQRGLQFYAEKLFNKDGSPRWTSDKDYPHDVHGAAQGIITFSRHASEYPGLAQRIATWSLDNLYSGRGYFYYQQRRHYTTRFTFMRWCNAWMARALARLLSHQACPVTN
jgi:hypothetical protein